MAENNSLFFKQKHWFWGIGIALVGIILSRVIAPNAPEGFCFAVLISGHLLCFAGLFTIAYGVHKKHKNSE